MYWQWLKDGKIIKYGRLARVLSATRWVDGPGDYAVRVRAHFSNGRRSEWASASVTCSADSLAAPANVSAVCSADGELQVSWGHRGPLLPRLHLEVEVDGTTVGSVNYRSVPSTVESYAYRWNGAESNRAHRVRVRVASAPAGVALGEDRESPWSGLVTANNCAVFKPAGFTTATCNAHGVVHLEWDSVGGADRYDLKNTAPGEESVNYEGPATEVYAPRWEGETYKFRIRARARTGQKWSGWTNPTTVQCDPLDPVLLTANRAAGVSPHWSSPNGNWVNAPGGRFWVAPQVLRYMPDDAKSPNLGRDNCTATKRNKDDDGWTRTCTFHWTEPLAVRLDEATAQKLSHPAHIDHSPTQHLHMDADGNPTTAAHQHCKADSDKDGQPDGDGTCPGPDNPNAPDLPWHTSLPPLDDNFWIEAFAASTITTSVSEAIGIGAAALKGALAGSKVKLGAVTLVSTLIGIGAGIVVVLLFRSDSKLYLVMNPAIDCFDFSIAGGSKWQQETAVVRHNLQNGEYETVYEHKIANCTKGTSS